MAPVTRPARDADAIARDEAARILAVHVGTVDRMTNRGQLGSASAPSAAVFAVSRAL
jgi:hypothetical protein